MKSLAIIVSEAAEIERMLIESEGELLSGIDQMLEVNAQELAAKADAYDMVMKRFESLQEHYKQREKFFQKIQKQCGYVQDRLKENIKSAMKELNTDEIEGSDIRFKLSSVKPSVVITEEDAIPREYFKEKTEFVLDKDRLKDDLSIGPVPGAELKQSVALRVYANTKKIGGKNE